MESRIVRPVREETAIRTGGPSESALQYLLRKHKTLKNDYKTPNGLFIESCGDIAFQIAKRLVAEGKEPFIVSFRETLDDGSTKPLEPLIYDGRVSWGAHIVCCVDAMVYDPMLGGPVRLEEYSVMAFGENRRMRINMDIEKTREVSTNII